MKIICVHQSADMYGSDRSFLQVVKYLSQSADFKKITIVLPRSGPLVLELEKLNVDIKYLNLSLLSKTYLMKLQWGKILFPLFQFRAKKKLFNEYDVVYANTSVILDFYLLAPFLRQMKIIHIREIPNKTLSKVLSLFLKQAKSKIIFNSHSTLKSFEKLDNSVVIHNAFEGFGKEVAAEMKKEERPLRVLLIGRINGWKGQDFAIESLVNMKASPVLLRIVGSTSAGNEDLVLQLKKKVEQLGLSNQVEFLDFVSDTAEIYAWSDVVIVPSTKPEPFGRIAIEAMSLYKPVIAANHGGLTEIIENGVSGYLFEPNNTVSFVNALSRYAGDRELLEQHGKNAKRTYDEKFSLNGFYKKLDAVFKKEMV
jgi:glycosyltransferase involved in cell wall biosynthesis